MQPYRPEGLTVSPPDEAALDAAIDSQQVLQAMCIKCDERHDLYVDLGFTQGIIPRQEGALSFPGSTTGEIAILNRVGKAVSFQVLGKDSAGNYQLSRKAAQLEARAYFFSALRPGDILKVRVLSAGKLGCFCDVGCGYPALMPIGRCCISRLETAAALHKNGDLISAALWQLQDDSQKIFLSGRETLGTWEENAEGFRQGQTVTGVVRTVMPYGIFVELTPNLSGLAEPMADIAPGDAVSVYIRSILPGKHKIKLNILEKLSHPLPRKTEYFVTSGHLGRWEYFPGSKALTCF